MPGTTSSLPILTQRSSQRPTFGRKGSCQQSRRQRNLDGLARAAQQQTLLTTVRVQACSHWSENVGFPSPCQSAVTRVIRVMGREILLLTAYFEHSVGFRSDTNANLMQDVCFLTRDGRCPFTFGGQVCGKICLCMEVASGPSNSVHRWSFRKAPRTRVVRVEAKNPTSSIISWCLHAFGPWYKNVKSPNRCRGDRTTVASLSSTLISSQCCPGSSLGKSADAVTTRWVQHWKVRIQTCWKKPIQHFGTQQDSNVLSKAESLAAVLGRKPVRRPVPNTQMRSVLWKSLMSWVTLWKLGATPQLNAGLLQEEWANSRCQGNSPNST